MDRQTRILCAVVLAMLMAAPALIAAAPDNEAKAVEAAKTAPPAKTDPPAKADAPAKADDAKKSAIDEESALLAKEAKLTPEQKAKLAEAVAAAKTAMDAWEKANDAKIQAFNKAMAAAREAKDRAAFQKALDDARPMLEESRALQQKHYKATMSILTPEQKATWVGYILWTDMTTQCKPLKLTAEQIAKMRTLCDATGKELVALPEGDAVTEADTKTRQAIQQKMVTGFVDGILTPEQRQTMKGPAAPPEGAPAK
jgi:Spy/CpxP family protein refolding chaperone